MTIIAAGDILLQHCGLSTSPDGSPHWYHYAGQQIGPEDVLANTKHGGTIVVGPFTLVLSAEVRTYTWTGSAWSGDSYHGYPAALPDYTGAASGSAYVKVYLATISGLASDEEVVAHGYSGVDSNGTYYSSDCADASCAYEVTLNTTTDTATASLGPASASGAYTSNASCPEWSASIIGSPAIYIQTFPPPSPPTPVPTSSCLADTTTVTLGWALRCFWIEAGSEIQQAGGTDPYGFSLYEATYYWSETELRVEVTAADEGAPWEVYGGTVSGQCMPCRVATTRPHGEGAVWEAWDSWDVDGPTVWYRLSPNRCTGWLPEQTYGDGYGPSISRGPDGRVLLTFIRAGNVWHSVYDGDAWGGEAMLLAGYDVQDHEVDRFSGQRFLVARETATGDLYSFRVHDTVSAYEVELGSAQLVVEGTDPSTWPSLRQQDDGTFVCAYFVAGVLLASRYANGAWGGA